MTTEHESTADMATRYADLKNALDAGYAELKQLEFDLLTRLRAEFPTRWADWERGDGALSAYGLTVPVTRTYDPNALRAEFGEDMPELVDSVISTQMVEKVTVDGRALAKLWKDAALAKRLAATIAPQKPTLKVTK